MYSRNDMILSNLKKCLEKPQFKLSASDKKFISKFVVVDGVVDHYTDMRPKIIHKDTPEERLIFYPVKVEIDKMTSKELNKLHKIAQGRK